MRLLYVCSDFGIPPDGTKGPSIHLRAITRALAERGHELLLLSPKEGPGDGHPARRLLPAGCTPVRESVRPLKRWMVARGLGDTLGKELRPLLYNAWVLDAARDELAKQPPDVVLERLSLFGHVGLDLSESCDVPLVLEVNALLTDESRRFRSLQLESLAETIEQRALRRADAIMTVSQPLAAQVAARGVPRHRIHVVENGADIERFEDIPSRETCRGELGLEDAFVIGFVGSLKSWHGADVLLESFAQLIQDVPAARLLIVGSGPMEAELREAAQREGLDGTVTFTGAVPHERVPRVIGAMDLAVAPYRSFDGFYFSPIKLFEYMAAGVCVVASRLGQIEDVIAHGKNGWLCTAEDKGELRNTFKQLHRDAKLRSALGEKGKQTVREKYTWAHAAQKVSRILDSAVAARAGQSSPADPLRTEGVLS